MTFERDLTDIGTRDVEQLVRKDKEYGSSWKRRGGIGAFMMLARKIDRIEEQVKRHGWDVFAAIEADPRPEGLLDDIGDLRRYLMLVESEILKRKRDAAVVYPVATDTSLHQQKHPFGFVASEEIIKRRSGFDLGNGHTAKSGDQVIVNGHPAKLIAVLQDGDADVEFADGSGATVKWREVFPALSVRTADAAK